MSAMEEAAAGSAVADAAQAEAHADPEALAQALWEDWALAAPVNPVILTEAYRISVYESRLKAGVLGALVKKGDRYSIYIDKGADLPQKRFTIAHELGHYFMHRHDAPPNGTIIDYRDTLAQEGTHRREREANLFAAALLMNRRDVMAMGRQMKSLPHLADFFGAPLETVKYRLETLEIRHDAGV